MAAKARSRDTLNVRQQQCRESEWKDAVHFLDPQHGGLQVGKPDGTSPTVTTWLPKFVIDMKTIEMTTTNNAIGRPGRNLSPNHNKRRLAKPMLVTSGSTWKNWLVIANRRSMKLRPPPGMPSRAGICVTAMLRAAPALKPSRTVSLMKLVRVLSRNSHATTHIAAATNAERDAI